MLDFMQKGGFMMWPLLALGVTAIVAAVRQSTHAESAIDPSRLARAVLAGGVGWCCMGLVRTFGHYCDEVSYQVYLTGIGESLTPAVLGLTTYAIVGVISSVARGRLSGPGQV